MKTNEDSVNYVKTLKDIQKTNNLSVIHAYVYNRHVSKHILYRQNSLYLHHRRVAITKVNSVSVRCISPN